MNRITEIQKQIRKLQEEKVELQNEYIEKDLTGMTKKEIQAYAMTLPEIPNHLWEIMQTLGFQTGSSVFGNIDNPSDIDWVVDIPAYAFLYAPCAVPCGKINQDYIDDDTADFVPLYANRNGQLYNIICIGNGLKLEAWRQTTDVLRHWCTLTGLKDAMRTKWKRVRLFRALTDILEPVKPLYPHQKPTAHEALQYDKCSECGREANNFTCKSAKDFYKTTSVCERCQENANG